MTSINFTTPLHGIGGNAYTLTRVAGADGLFSLQSVAHAARLFLLDAAKFIPGYHPKVSGEQLGALGLDRAEDASILVVTNPNAGNTVNLAAPILINPANGSGTQIIVDDDLWPIRVALADVV
ncbi:MAG: flagellar assembly protein FliW [Acidobacteria bacterium]|nr:flagellar assembly protein FliW [Acidobacteriota bacterium]